MAIDAMSNGEVEIAGDVMYTLIGVLGNIKEVSVEAKISIGLALGYITRAISEQQEPARSTLFEEFMLYLVNAIQLNLDKQRTTGGRSATQETLRVLAYMENRFYRDGPAPDDRFCRVILDTLDRIEKVLNVSGTSSIRNELELLGRSQTISGRSELLLMLEKSPDRTILHVSGPEFLKLHADFLKYKTSKHVPR
ncbi:MAG: hypothetical protein ABSF83_00710 [Nitrososphaerales archaeon]|jgi:hypothetical protein